MISNTAVLYGELAAWPDMERMVTILQAAGLRLQVGKFSIRIKDLLDFTFQEYGGDLGAPRIDADAEDVKTLAAEAKRLSEIFAAAGLVHRFEIYEDGRKEMSHYFHHGWPRAADT